MKYQNINALLPLIAGGDEALSHPGALLDLVTQAETFDDVLPHLICEFDVSPARTNLAVVFLSAHDDAGNQIAFALTGFTITRFGAGPILIFGGATPVPVGLAFVPGGPVWTADLVELTPGRLGIQVTDVGSPGVPIRWKATIAVFGTQVK
jgi:hypothetical protein